MLEPTDIRRVWEKVLTGLWAIKRDMPVYWRPEDVYAKCVNGSAHLYTAPEGFVVLEKRTNAYTLEVELLVWIAYGEGPGLMEKYQQQIEDIGRGVGAARLVMYSPRRGFEKRADMGWEFETAIYRRPL